MNQFDLVSVIAPCYNGEKTIEPFLNSILAQTYENIELLLINDGSTDETEKIITEKYSSKFKQRGINLVYHFQENQGAAEAINWGLSRFRGNYLMWVDSDDILYCDNIKKKVDFLQNNQQYGFVVAQEEKVHSDNLNTPISISKRQHNDDSHYFEDMLNGRNVVFGPGTIMVRRTAFLNTFPDRRIFPSREGQNWQLMLPLIYSNKCGYIDEVLLKCVVYENSHSHKQRSFEEKISRNDGIAVLLCETINSIEAMSSKEKQKWLEYITCKYARGGLYLCYEFNKLELAKKYRGILKQNHAYTFKCTRFACEIKKQVIKIRKQLSLK